MWIRSQDKKSLVNVSAIEIEVDTNAQVVRGFGDSTSVIDYWELGEYSTEEKALKVLDMIQKEICNINEFVMLSNMVKRCDDKYIDINYDGWVFQMPQNSEVE